jgi:hypothetical protein
MARTEKNEPVGLEIELNVSEALVPGLSEPGMCPNASFVSILEKGQWSTSYQHERQAWGFERQLIGWRFKSMG